MRYRKLVKDELSRLEKCGVVTKVFRSDWACPTVNVLKKSGEIRICGDYSLTLNKVMNLVQYPLPTIEDVLSQISNAEIFSKIDLKSAYLQLPLDDESKSLTTINTSEGLYSFNYLPFGIASSPGIFQSFICQVLSGINNIVIYQDDVCIATKTESEHHKILDQVLNALFNAAEIIEIQKLIRKIPVADNVVEYAVSLVGKTRPNSDLATDFVKKYIDWGAGPRASQNLILAAKAHAAVNGKYSPDIEDVQAVAIPILSHRIVKNYKAEAEGITISDIITSLL